MPSASRQQRLTISLLALRIGVFVVMIVWTLDKFLNPGHSQGVFERFYGMPGLDTGVTYAIGAAQLLVVLAFAAGFLKRFSYGLVLLMHGVSTLSSYAQYLDPYNGANILFFAAWPMLAACLALYLLRDDDRIASIDAYRGA
jgi:uncharacterized membrane protein